METLQCLIDCPSYKIDEQLKALIIEHLQSMEYEFQHYFPELKGEEAILA